MKRLTMTHNLLTQKCTAMLSMLLLLLFAVLPQVAQADAAMSPTLSGGVKTSNVSVQTDDASSTDERLQAFTLDGVTVKIEDSAEYPWAYDATNSWINSGNKRKHSTESSIKLTFSADAPFSLSFEYGASNERSDKALFYIDGTLYKRIGNETLITQSFCYVFEKGGEHVVEVKYIKNLSVDKGQDIAFLRNIVAKTDISDVKPTTTLYAKLSGDEAVLTYAPIQLPCYDLVNSYAVATDYEGKALTIEESVKNYAPESFESLFDNLRPTTISGLSNLNFSNATNLSRMFFNCSKLTSLDLSQFNTEKVTDMSHMFNGCSGLKELVLPSHKAGSVTNMSHMFDFCRELTSLDLSSLNTENVTDMSYMFSYCLGLTSLDLSPLNTEKVTNMRYMFGSCSGLTSLDLSPLKTENVTNMSYLFRGCSGLTSLDLSPLKTEKVTDMSYMFRYCSGLTSLDLSPLKTENVTNMSYLFGDCSGLTSLDLSPLNTGSVTDMSYMFENCSGLTSLDLSPLNTGSVTDMSHMFRLCKGLNSLDLSSLNTENLTNMSYMFEYCSGLTNIDLFDTENVTNMSFMFVGCTGLTNLDLSSLNTEKVTNMRYMFGNCSGLTNLDLSSLNTENVTDMSYMFKGCSGLTTIYAKDKFYVPTTGCASMFDNCTSLVGAISYEPSNVPFEVANYKTGYFKTYYQVGDVKHDLFGEELKVDNLELKDGENFKAVVPFTATNVTYNREVKGTAATRWGSICLPYAITAPTNCKLYTLSGVQMNNTSSEGTIIMEEVDQLEAGTPAFYCVKDANVTSVNFNASDAAIVNTLVDNSENAVDGVYLKGTYTTQAIDEGYVLMNNSMWNAATVKAQNNGKTVNSKGLRAYLALAPNASAAAQKLNFDAKETTGIESVINVMNDADAEIYDASGRRQGSLQRGLNIIRKANGKSVKVMVK